MKAQRVYVDTSVIGGCFDPKFAPWSNGLFKDFRIGTFVPVVSEIVAREIALAPAEVRASYAELRELGAEMLSVDDEVAGLATAFHVRNVLPRKYSADGLHIALATVAGVDVLVSWNFKHIVHLDRIRLFSSVAIEFGYSPIVIRSPREVTHYEEEA